jgi:hypothetical protein
MTSSGCNQDTLEVLPLLGHNDDIDHKRSTASSVGRDDGEGRLDTVHEQATPPPPSHTIIIIIMRVAADTYALFTAVVVLFQLALAAGAPWGRYAMGGMAVAGSRRRSPMLLRCAALVQAIFLLLMAEVVLVRAGWIVLYHFSGRGGGGCGCSGRRCHNDSYWLTIEVVVTICAVSLFLNLIPPSPDERRIWAPVAAILFFSSLTVAVLSSSSQGVAGRHRG